MTAKTLTKRPSDLIGIDPDSEYERFEFDQAVAGLGRYIDGKLEELDDKTFKPVYPTLDKLLNTVKRDKPRKQERKLTAPPPRFRRRSKK